MNNFKKFILFLKNPKLKEEQHRAFDIIAKVITGLSAIILLIIGYLQFKALYTKEYELKLYSEKINYVVNVNKLMGGIANERNYNNKENLKLQIDKFKQLWYVKNVFLEDSELLNCMAGFNNRVNEVYEGIDSLEIISLNPRIKIMIKDDAECFAKRSNQVLKKQILE